MSSKEFQFQSNTICITASAAAILFYSNWISLHRYHRQRSALLHILFITKRFDYAIFHLLYFVWMQFRFLFRLGNIAIEQGFVVSMTIETVKISHSNRISTRCSYVSYWFAMPKAKYQFRSISSVIHTPRARKYNGVNLHWFLHFTRKIEPEKSGYCTG